MDAGRERRAVKKAMKDDREEESVRHVDGRFPEGRKMRGSRSVDDRFADVTLSGMAGRRVGGSGGRDRGRNWNRDGECPAMTGRGVVGAGGLKGLPQAGARSSRSTLFINDLSMRSSASLASRGLLTPQVCRLSWRLTNAVSSRTSEPYRDCPDSQATSRDPHGDSGPALDLAGDSTMPSPARALTRSALWSLRTRRGRPHD